MFGFGKKKKDEKRKSKLDKLIMGAIVGGAVGSIIGMTIAPQKGKETREMIAQKGKDLINKYYDPTKPGTHQDEELVEEEVQQKQSLLSRAKNALFGGHNKKIKKNLLKDKDVQKIPNEVE